MIITEVEHLRLAAVSRSTDIETYLFQLAGEQKQLHTTHEAVISMDQETYDAQPKFSALPPDITTPHFASIEEATHLLQEAVSTAQGHYAMITHRRSLLGHAITSLTLHPSVAIHRCDYYAELARQDRRPQGDLSVSKVHYSPNLRLLQMVTEQQVATARAAATAFDANGNRVAPPTLPLGTFHLFPLPFLSLNP
jgi:hypothetical protein